MKRHGLLIQAILGLTAATLPLRADYAAEILADAPLVYYRFEESSGPVAANLGSLAGADGAYSGAGVALGAESASPVMGRAVALDGMEGFVGVPALDQPLAQFTLEMWLQRTYDWPGLTALYANDGWAGGFLHLNLVSSDSDPLIEFAVNGNPVPNPRFAPAWAVGEWHHVVVTYDSMANPPQLRLYFDGLPQPEVQLASAIPVSFTGGRLGMWDAQRQFEGLIDEFALYSSVLGADRIAARYQTVFPEARIAAQPADQVVLRGENAHFEITATGADLEYQWLRNGQEIAGATQPQYDLAAQTADDGARYSVRVSNQVNSVVSDEALLTVISEASILVQPADAYIGEGYSAVFGVVAQGPDLHYQWFRDGQAIAGATQPAYATGPVSLADEGAVFTVTVTNDVNGVTSVPARLTVFSMPSDVYGKTVIADEPLVYYRCDESGGLTARNLGRLGSAGEGSYAPSGVQFGGPSAFTGLGSAIWLDGFEGHVAVPALNEPLAQMTIELWLSRTYDWPGLTALVANDAWQSGALHLNLVEASPGPLVEFAVNGNSVIPRFNLEWGLSQWYYLTLTYDASAQPGQLKLYLDGALRAQVEIPGARAIAWTGGRLGSWTTSRQLEGSLDEFAWYDTVLSSERIEARYNAVQREVTIAAGPDDATVLEGASATFKVLATGPDRAYQWLRNGTPIEGAVADACTVTAVMADNGARFSVRVSNDVSSVTSAEAQLTVVGIPQTDYATTVLEDMPAVYYRFEETAGAVAQNLGSLGDAAAGAYSESGLSFDQASAGPELGRALRFAAGHVEVPDLGMGPVDQLTFELWLNRQSDPTDFFALFATHGWAASGLHFNIAAGALGEFAVNGNPTPWSHWSAGAIGQWNHWAATYDLAEGQAQIKVYVNGSLAATGAASTPILLDGGRIGRWGEQRAFDGYLDEVAIYSSTLAHEQVLRHYAAARIPEPVDEVELHYARLVGGELEISWTGPGFVLESTTDLSAPGAWVAVPEGVASPVRVLMQDVRQFYRLRKP